MEYKLVFQWQFVLYDPAAKALEAFCFGEGHLIADGEKADAFMSERGETVNDAAHTVGVFRGDEGRLQALDGTVETDDGDIPRQKLRVKVDVFYGIAGIDDDPVGIERQNFVDDFAFAFQIVFGIIKGGKGVERERRILDSRHDFVQVLDERKDDGYDQRCVSVELSVDERSAALDAVYKVCVRQIFQRVRDRDTADAVNFGKLHFGGQLVAHL